MITNWIICLFISITVFLCGIVYAFFLVSKNRKERRLINTIQVLIISTFISALVMFLPIYNVIFSQDSLHCIKVFLLSIHNAIRLFIVDGEFTIILEHMDHMTGWVATVYSVFAAVLFVVAPILTFGVVISFFLNISSYIRYLLGFSKDVYAFSELNAKSLALSESLKKKEKNYQIIFTDVFEKNEETSYELVERAHEIGAICFKKDITTIGFGIYNKKRTASFFLIGEDESENIDQALKLISKYKEQKNINLYVFSSTVDGELLLASMDTGLIKVRRIDDIRSLVNRILYDEGQKLFESARPDGDKKRISAVVVGLGQFGSYMVKTLSWFCQMDGYLIDIDAFDLRDDAESKFTAQCPELMSSKYNGVMIPGEAYYKIKIHSGISADSKLFTEIISQLNHTTYVFVALGDDGANIKTATYLRMLFERVECKPLIQAIVFNPDRKVSLSRITNYRGQPYDIEFIGDFKTSYSEEVIIDYELEQRALERHLRWGEEDDFWKYEYNYRSSVASAMHRKMKEICHIPGIEKQVEERTQAECWNLRELEHRRWNAYMRSEGYCYAPQRNDMAKTHHCLVPFDKLPEEEQMKDDD